MIMTMKVELKLKRFSNKKIKACDISQDNRVFGFQVKGYTVLQDCQTDTLIHIFKNSSILYYGCKFSQNNQWFAFIDNEEINIYNLQSNQLTQIPSKLYPVQLIMNDRFVVCYGNQGYQTIQLGTFVIHYINQINYTRISTHYLKSDLFISYGHINYLLGLQIVSTIRIVYWHCSRDKWIKYFVIPHYYHNFKLYQAISKSFVATYFFSEYGNLKVSFYNHQTQKLLFTINGYIVANLAFSPCENYLILKTSEFVIIDLSNRKIKTIPIEKRRFIFFTDHKQSIIETSSDEIRVLKLQLM